MSANIFDEYFYARVRAVGLIQERLDVIRGNFLPPLDAGYWQLRRVEAYLITTTLTHVLMKAIKDANIGVNFDRLVEME